MAQKKIRSISEILEENRRLTKLVSTDSLTDILNRRGLDNFLSELMIDASEKGYDLSLAYGDIDDFKKINDEYGHDTGDEILIGLATALKENMRFTDASSKYENPNESAVGRIGGDEFVTVFPYTTPEGTLNYFKRLRENIDTTPTINFTFGVARYDPMVHTTPKELKDAADQILIAGKKIEKGRDYLLVNDEVRAV